jgi:hypothetical protein
VAVAELPDSAHSDRYPERTPSKGYLALDAAPANANDFIDCFSTDAPAA